MLVFGGFLTTEDVGQEPYKIWAVNGLIAPSHKMHAVVFLFLFRA